MSEQIRVKWEMDGGLFKASYQDLSLVVKKSGNEYFWWLYKSGTTTIIDCIFYHPNRCKSDGDAKVKAEQSLFRNKTTNPL